MRRKIYEPTGVEHVVNEAAGDFVAQLITLPDGGGFLIKGRLVVRDATLSRSQASQR